MGYSFVMRGQNATIQDMSGVVISNKLDVGTYNLKYDERFDVINLERVADMTKPIKLYGQVTKRVNRIIDRFLKRVGNTGVLLSGIPGSGKTVLARELASKCLALDIPVILVPTPTPVGAMQRILTAVGEKPIMFLFDELEKTHDQDDLNGMLTFLDGTSSSKAKYLSVITVNDIDALPDPFFSRPNRVYLHYTHGGVDETVIDEIIEDRLINKQFAASLRERLSRTFYINMDSLINLIDEMNIGQIGVDEALDGLNIEVQMPVYYTPEVTVSVGNKKLKFEPYRQCLTVHIDYIMGSSFTELDRSVHNPSWNLMGTIKDPELTNNIVKQLSQHHDMTEDQIQTALNLTADEMSLHYGVNLDVYINSSDWVRDPDVRCGLKHEFTYDDTYQVKIKLIPIFPKQSTSDWR